MQVQRIQNYNYNPQFKGYIKLISPTGTSVTIKPECIEALYSQNVNLFCRRQGEQYYNNLLKHVISITKVVFSSKMLHKCVVNATDSTIFKAMNEAKRKPDNEIIEVGEPLLYLKAINDGQTYDNLPTYDINELKQLPNTVGVYPRGDFGNWEDVEYHTKYLGSIYGNEDYSYISMMLKIIKKIGE